LLNQFSRTDQLSILSKLFTKVVLKVSVPDDFLVFAAKAMDCLKCNYRSNVLYKLAKDIGTMREDETDSRLPTKRMPMGPVEYAADFYANDNLQSVRIFNKRRYIKYHKFYLDIMSHGLSFMATNNVLLECNLLCTK